MSTGNSSSAEQVPEDFSVASRIIGALRRGPADFQYLLSCSFGADPRVVKEKLDYLRKLDVIRVEENLYRLVAPPRVPNWAKARACTIAKYGEIPHPNPLGSQWWFNLDTLSALAEIVWEYIGKGLPAFLGTPMLGYFYSKATQSPCTVLDIDGTILAALDFPSMADHRRYNVAEEIPGDLVGKHRVVAIDPPWYEEMFEAFLKRSEELASSDSILVCAVPGPLTRPNILEERDKLIKRLTSEGYGIIGLEMGKVSYIVPEFEIEAYRDIQGFDERSWRFADLIVAVFPEESKRKSGSIDIELIEHVDFRRDAERRRIFLRKSVFQKGSGPLLEEIEEFSDTVSSRIVPASEIGLWTSDKKGYKIRQPEILEKILELWCSGSSFQDVLTQLQDTLSDPKNALDEMSARLGLWSEEGQRVVLRRHEELNDVRRSTIDPTWASSPSEPKYPREPDMFRLEFQRDRDRILWSKGFKHLAAKTQVFPVEHSGHLRRRLTHTMEVKQLAHTIATCFGLDLDLTEAIALAHDIGHAPFGHAGEEAINTFLGFTERLGGFNHYEHGVDILCWLEDAYLSPGAGGESGLNLHKEIYEGVFKHMYHKNKSTGRKSQEEFYARTKHVYLFNDDFCHLEGQAVRLADKISYLIEDLEDGIRAGVLSLKQIAKCRLFARSPIDLQPAEAEVELERFISQRRAILNVLMSDALEETERQLSSKSSIDEVRGASRYCVKNSSVIEEDVRQTWKTIQVGILHRHPKVVRSNIRAATVVRMLMGLFVFCPDVVDHEFHRSFDAATEGSDYLSFYEEHGERITVPESYGEPFEGVLSTDKNIEHMKGGGYEVPVKNLILAKDYVASMTDDQALRLYREHIQGEIPPY